MTALLQTTLIAAVSSNHVTSMRAITLGSRLHLLAGTLISENNGYVSFVVRELVMNFMWCLSVVVRRCPASCMLSCLKHSGVGRTSPQQTFLRMQCGSLWHKIRDGWLRLSMHASNVHRTILPMKLCLVILLILITRVLTNSSIAAKVVQMMMFLSFLIVFWRVMVLFRLPHEPLAPLRVARRCRAKHCNCNCISCQN